MKYLGLALVLGLAVASFMLPVPEPPAPSQSGAARVPSVAVCPVEQGSGRSTEISILSSVDGPAQLTLFAGGEPAGSLGTSTGASRSVRIPVSDVAAVGTVGGLVEMPVASSATGAVVTGASSFSAETCTGASAPETFITGGSTVSGETLVLHLMNPYAGQAIVELLVNSEAGVESNERFESIIVPPRSSTLLDLTDLIPGRSSISANILTSSGSVVSVARQGVEGDSALWGAVEAAQDWFLPVPGGSEPKELLIATPANADIDYQVDLYGPEGLEEAFQSGTLPPRGQTRLDLAEIGEDPFGLRVVTSGPVAAMLWANQPSGLVATTGSAVQATSWFLPGAAMPPGGRAAVVVLNAGLEDVSVSFRAMRDRAFERVMQVAAGDTVELSIGSADGYLVEASGPVVSMWTARRGSVSSAAIGAAVPDG